MVQESGSEKSNTLQVQGYRVVLGAWSGDLEELVAKSAELRERLRDARIADARALVQSQSVEEQAALVAMNENPEQVLSLTGMDEKGHPGYRSEVVDKLPADVFAEILVPRNARHIRFNTEVLQKMTPEGFKRAVEDTLDPVYFHGNRTRISWEWLEAVAALDDHGKIAQLLFKADLGMLEEALLDKLDHLDLGGTAGGTEVAAVSRLQVFAEGLTGGRPGDYVEDDQVGQVLDALYQAAPELMAKLICGAVRRLGGTP